MRAPPVILFSGIKRSGKDTAATLLALELERLCFGLRTDIKGFATPLKELINRVFPFLPYNALHGSDSEKEAHLSWQESSFSGVEFRQELTGLLQEPGLRVDMICKAFEERVMAMRAVARIEGDRLICPGCSGRKLAQQIGTEIFRNMIDDNFWVNLAIAEIADQAHLPFPTTSIFTDARFPQEIETGVFATAPLIFVKGRGGTGDSHSSEAMVSDPGFPDRVLARPHGYVVDNSGTLDDLRAQMKTIAQKLTEQA